MKQMSLRLISAACSFALVGCTSLSTRGELRTADMANAVKGVPYALPQLQYDVKITRTLAQCEEPALSAAVPANSKKSRKKPPSVPVPAAPPVDALKFTVKAEATSAFVAGERYMLDYEKLAGFTKISSITLDYYENGSLKSINASAEDRSAAIIGDLGKAAFSIARIAMGIPGGSGAPEKAAPEEAAQEPILVCSAAAKTVMADVKKATILLTDAKTELESRTDRVTKLTDQLKLGTLNSAGKGKLQKAIDAQTEQAVLVTDRQGALDKLTAKLSVTTTERISFASDQLSGFLPLRTDGLDKLLPLVDRKMAPKDSGDPNVCNLGDAKACLPKVLQAEWAVQPLAPSRGTPLEDGNPLTVKTADAQKGIFVRQPEAARLLLCRTGKAPVCSTRSDELLFTSSDAMAPQLGQLRFLPFRNEMFQNNSLVLSLRENGSIEKFEYKDLKAQGEVMAAAAADLAAQGLSFADARRKDRLDDTAAKLAKTKADRQAEIDAIQFQIDLLTKQQSLSKLGNTDLATVQDQIALITKQRELDKLLQTPAVTALETVKADTELSNASTALYEAQLAERKAKAALAE